MKANLILLSLAAASAGWTQTNDLAPSSDAFNWITLAGHSDRGAADGIGTEAQFRFPSDVAVSATGEIFVADYFNYTIRKISAAGVVSTIAGFAGSSGVTDGLAQVARFGGPQGLAVDAAGEVFVADIALKTIRKLTPTSDGWVVRTLAGLPSFSGTTDGTNRGARFTAPSDVAVADSATLYVTDGHTIRKMVRIGTNWVVSTIAGSAGNGGSADGTNASARFHSPSGIVTYDATNIFVADTGNHSIRRLVFAGTNRVVSTIAGLPGSSGSADGTNSVARFLEPRGIAADSSGNLYVADRNHTIRKIRLEGTNWVVSTLAGLAGAALGSINGTGPNARFRNPSGVTVDGAGNIFVADEANCQIRQVTSAGTVSTVAGVTGSDSGVDGVGRSARFSYPHGAATDAAGSIYVGDFYAIRRVTSSGLVSTLAGRAGSSGANDGVGYDARFRWARGIALDSGGTVYVTDYLSHTVRRITPAGVVTTIAGLAGVNGPVDGTNSAARFDSPLGITVDSETNLYVADSLNFTIRKIRPAGTNWVVTTIAGLARAPGTADGTNNTTRFSSPQGITVVDLTNLCVADGTTLRTLRLFGTNWVASTIAGLSGDQAETDGTGTNARFVNARGIAVDRSGSLLVVDSPRKIRKVAPVGSNWVVSTLGGSINGSADGVGSAAQFDFPEGITVDRLGNVYVADSVNHAIRKGVFSLYTPTNPVAYTPPPMNGQLRITLLPPQANGQWRFPWELSWRNSGATASNLVAGNYPVEFRSQPGWLAIPPNFNVPVTNTVSLTTNLYYPTLSTVDTNSGGGSLTVNIGPSPPAGVGWRFIGDTTLFFPSGYTTNLLAGTYLIEFASVSGYSKPPNYSVQVQAARPSVLAMTYLLASGPPAGALLPFPVPANQITDVNSYPFGFNGQLRSDTGSGSGVAVLENVVLTVAHLVFNDQTLSYVSRAHWYFRQETGFFEPKPLEARGWFLLRGYAAQRTNDVLGGLGPDSSSPQSRNMDVAALYFLSPVAGGGYGGYLPSHHTPNPWLAGNALKMLVGYPVDGSIFGDASLVPGRMYQTDPQPYPLTLATEPVAGQQVYVAPWFLSYPGNSGGPVYAQFNGYFYPAGVYLGTLFNGVQPYASAVRAIDSNVVNLITLAASQGDSGTNNTGGGVITFIPGLGASSNSPGHVQFELRPPSAVRAGAGWRLSGDSAFGSASDYTRQVRSNRVVEFREVSGWRAPSNQNVTVEAGQIAHHTAFYTVTNPLLVLQRFPGPGTRSTLGMTGTTGTVYQLERKSALTNGTWSPVNTSTNLTNGFKPLLSLTNPPTSFYRLQWLTNF